MHLLTAFIDGLKPESIKNMPFVSTLERKNRITSELGYSNPAHASMYSGVHPNKHLFWFIWQYSPNTSPFKIIKALKVDKLPHNLYSKYLCYKYAQLQDHRVTSFYGIPFIHWMPIEKWHYFDVSEKKFWTEQKYIDHYPTIFEELRQCKVDYETIGLVKHDAKNSSNIIDKYNGDIIKKWTYLFFGDIDPLSHKFGQTAPETQDRLRKIDSIIEKYYKKFESTIGEFRFMLFSDHGHIPVTNSIDINKVFREGGGVLSDYIYFIDSNFVRFWPKNESEKKRINSIMSSLDDIGFLMSDQDLVKYHVNMPDNRYGDIIYYLDVPNVFHRGTVKSIDASAHGYLPEHPDSDGVLITNTKEVQSREVKLVDIFPSILDNFDLKIPDYVDGKSIWK